MQISKNRFKFFFILTSFLFFQLNQFLTSKDEIVEILQSFKNYRYGNVYIYQIDNSKDFEKIFKNKNTTVDSTTLKLDKSCLEKIKPKVKEIVERLAKNSSKKLDDVIAELDEKSGEDYEYNSVEVDCAFTVIKEMNKSGKERDRYKFYLITTKPTKPNTLPTEVIGFIYRKLKSDSDVLKDNLETVSPKEIFSIDKMESEKIDAKEFGTDNLYDLAKITLKQGNLINKTMEARAIGNVRFYFTEKVGISEALIKEDIPTPENIQLYKRISEGAPLNLYLNNNEIVAGLDQIKWTTYDPIYQLDEDGKIVVQDKIINQRLEGKKTVSDTIIISPPILLLDSLIPFNTRLPKYGFELKYGFEDINYKSLLSERMTLSAMWNNVKFGVILPTNGWSQLSKDLFSQDRKLTFASIGVAGKIDLPIALIPNSDVFSFSFSNVFGDAQKSSFNVRNNSTLDFNENINNPFDYLIRSTAQLHYTFGISVDKDYLFRFGVGGTYYSVEKWRNQLVDTNGINGSNPKLNFYKYSSQGIGGISTKIEFMNRGTSTPFGFYLQYFDESLAFSGWLLIPIIENSFAIKFEANSCFSPFRDNPREWEAKSTFIPMLKFLFMF